MLFNQLYKCGMPPSLSYFPYVLWFYKLYENPNTFICTSYSHGLFLCYLVEMCSLILVLKVQAFYLTMYSYAVNAIHSFCYWQYCRGKQIEQNLGRCDEGELWSASVLGDEADLYLITHPPTQPLSLHDAFIFYSYVFH